MVYDGIQHYIYDQYKFIFYIEVVDDKLQLFVTIYNQHDDLTMEESFPLGTQLAKDWLLFQCLLAAVGPQRPAVVQVEAVAVRQ